MKGGLAEEAGSALFWKALLQGGTHLIYLLRLLILARVLAPEDFGLLAIAMTGIGMSLRLTDLGIQPSLVQRPSLTDQHYDTAWTIGVLILAVAVAGAGASLGIRHTQATAGSNALVKPPLPT